MGSIGSIIGSILPIAAAPFTGGLSLGADVLLEGGLGALGAVIGGGNPLLGALGGAAGPLFGGAADALGATNAISSGLGLSQGVAGDLVSALGGGLSGAISSGGNPLSILTGAAGAGLGSALNNSFDLQGLLGADVTSAAPGTAANPTSATSSADTSSISDGGALSSSIPAGQSGIDTALSNALITPGTSGAGLGALSGSDLSTPSTAAISADNSFVNGTSPSSGVMNLANSAGPLTTATSGGGSVAIPGAGASGNNVSGNDGSSGGILSRLGSYAAKNPAQILGLGLAALQAANRPELPTLAQQQASTQGAAFNAPLPQFKLSTTTNPISNYYTYGYSPQPLQIQNTLTPVSSGGQGLVVPGSAAGGRIQGYAFGGRAGGIRAPSAGGMRAPRIGPAMPRIPHPSFTGRRSAGAGLAALGAMSHARAATGSSMPASVPTGAPGGVLPGFSRGGDPRMTFARDGHVAQRTGTKGQADKIPAMLSEDEYVLPADVTSSLGDGSPAAGSGVLDQFVKNVRAHKAVKGQPPKAKRPEQYLPKRKK